MAVTQSNPHYCDLPKNPCSCFPKIKPGRRTIIPDVIEHNKEFVEHQLARARLDNSPMSSINNDFQICGSDDESSPPTCTALHIKCGNCEQQWCYTNEASMRRALKKSNMTYLALTDEFDRIILALTCEQTLIHQHTRWQSNAKE